MKKKLSIAQAVGVLVADVDRRLAARPLSWRGSAEALVLHSGQLYRISTESPAPDGPPHHLTASSITDTWEVVSRQAAIAEEITDEEEVASPKRRESRRRKQSASVRPPGARGRPTVADVIASLPESERANWSGIVEAAAALQLSRDLVRRWAKDAPPEAVRRIRGSTLIHLATLQTSGFAAGRAPEQPISAEVEATPAPVSDLEVYS